MGGISYLDLTVQHSLKYALVERSLKHVSVRESRFYSPQYT